MPIKSHHSTGSSLSGMGMVTRGRYRTSFLFVFFVLLLALVFLSINSQFNSVVNNRKPISLADEHSVHHHLHECLCNVSVSLQGMDKSDQNLGHDIKLVTFTGNNESVENIYRKHYLPIKPSVLPVVNIDFAKITLKPNISRMINATREVTTVNAVYVLENPALCSSVKDLSIIIIIHSSPDHFQRRSAIRQSWANDAFYKHLGTVRVLFLLGLTTDKSVQDSIKTEFDHFGDILQGDFKDDYHNLTLKGVMAYRWLTERCRNPKFVMKVDDDISVNMFKVLTDVYPKYKNASMQITCNHILTHSMPILRQNDSKWFVSENHFRGMDSFPTDYCSGFLVLFTNDMIPALYESSRKTPFFWVDDVYLYGLVPGNVPNITYVGLTGPWHQLSGQVALQCYKNLTATCPFLVAGAGAKGEMEELWPHMVRRYALSLE